MQNLRKDHLHGRMLQLVNQVVFLEKAQQSPWGYLVFHSALQCYSYRQKTFLIITYALLPSALQFGFATGRPRQTSTKFSAPPLI